MTFSHLFHLAFILFGALGFACRVLFLDGYDLYAVPSDKWTNGNGANNNDLTGTKARTGIGCGVIDGVLAPSYALGATVGPIYQGAAMMVTNINGGGKPCSFRQGGNIVCSLNINSDGSVNIRSSGGFSSPNSAPNLVQNNTYAYFELSCSLSGNVVTATARVNGFVVLTGVTYSVGGSTNFDSVYPEGPGGGATGYIDDLYICDGTGGVNNGFLGAVRIYSGTPVADSTPLDWTTSTGTTHYVLVNEIPPDNGTTFVSDNVVGDQDQYLHATGSPPVGDKILAVQHCIDLNLAESGSRQVSSCINGTPHGAATITTTFHIYTQPYDVNPVTGTSWKIADFATLPIGVDVTA